MEGLQTVLFLCEVSGVKTRSTEGGRSKCLGGCGNFSQLGLCLGDSHWMAGKERIPEAAVQGFLPLGKESQ